ncbi:hypothetical protein XS16_004529 [Salmonella enterica subsp. enterica serovar Newport]|nr:hypothetical protein [Salmonella enterica subsp. enterica serovar Newport]
MTRATLIINYPETTSAHAHSWIHRNAGKITVCWWRFATCLQQKTRSRGGLVCCPSPRNTALRSLHGLKQFVCKNAIDFLISAKTKSIAHRLIKNIFSNS